ncbi:MAG TPA: protoheme IX farnesyltransferase [Archaeoglobaceae archaeon]|nr:protoheme IX farnesyltransferase [Archaeoglobaceae archaeon]
MEVKPYLEVTKPKQTVLLMVTCVISYIVAGDSFNIFHFIVTCIAVFLAVAGTTALNMWLDRDIDSLMSRTRHRPVPSGRLSDEECAFYGSILFLIGFAIGLKINFYLAIVLLMGLFFDIIIYTILLKRMSPYSIVLGGVAGAMPSLAGWTAAAGRIELTGIIISTIILLWIPAHIWYLSIHFEEDYRLAGIPMLPLVVGMEKASWAIVISTGIMLILVSLLYLMTSLGTLYLSISFVFTSYFLYRTIKFAKSPSREKAKHMYKLASITLGVIYLSMLIGSLG